jgi:glycosyltransferase involved in cell wall biosynthesis
MKIAQIAPLMESVPPRLYGGTERVVSYLVEQLVALGHDVTLFASADSVTSARLVGCATTALRLDPNVVDYIPYYMLMLEKVRQLEQEFDILHFHIDYLHFPLFRGLAGRTITTLHGRQDLPDNKTIFIEFDDMPLVSISESQRKPIPDANLLAMFTTDCQPMFFNRTTIHPVTILLSSGACLRRRGPIAPSRLLVKSASL